MASKVCYLATYGRHWKPLEVAGATVSNQCHLDAVLLGCEKEADEVGLSDHGVGRRCGVVGFLPNEELDVFEPEEVLGGVSTSLEVFAFPEE